MRHDDHMADRPRPPRIPREEPGSDPPRYERPQPRPAFVTRVEVELMIERALWPLHQKMDRVITLQERSEQERERRSQAEASAQLLAATVRTAEAIERATPAHAFPTPGRSFPTQPPIPTALNSGPPKSQYSRTQIVTAIVAALAAVAVAAISAYASQHQHPYGAPTTEEHKP
jgi:hypothetical protein